MQGVKRAALKAAFPKTIPIFFGFMFLGLTYGIYMNSSGFWWLWPTLISVVIYAGAMEFVAVPMLLGAFQPVTAFLMTLMICARHLFYGISMLDKYKGLGIKKVYMIFGMVDETFSISCRATVPEDIDRSWYFFFITLLNHIYWVCGSFLGGVLGSFIPFSTKGIDFVLTALLVVIFLDNFLTEKNHTSSIAGIALSLISLLIFGQDLFIIPAMVAILIFLTAMRRPLEKGGKI